MPNVFDPGTGYLTPNEGLANALNQAGSAFAQAIARRGAASQEVEKLLLEMDPEKATAVVQSLGDAGLRRLGLNKKRALELAATVAGGGQVRPSTPTEVRAGERDKATLEREQAAGAQAKLSFGALREQVGGSLIDATTNKPLDPGRREVQLKRIESGQPLQNARYADDLVRAAEQAGFPDDVPSFLVNKREQTELATREQQARTAGVEQSNFRGTAGALVTDEATGQLRDPSAQERVVLAQDPFGAGAALGVVLPDAVEQQVGAWAKGFFGGDREKARSAIASLTVELPTEQARQAILSSRANIEYMQMLSERLSQEIGENAAGAKALTPEQRRLALADLKEAYTGAVGLGGKLAGVKAVKFDPETGQPKLGGIFWKTPVGPENVDVPENKAALTVEDMVQLTIPPIGESPTDRTTILARLQNLVVSKVGAGARNVSEITVMLDAVDKDGNKITPREYNLEQFVLVLSKARVSGARYRALAQQLGIGLGEERRQGAPGGGVLRDTQPPVLNTGGGEGGGGGSGGTALDTLESTVFGPEVEALRKRAAGQAAPTPPPTPQRF